MVEIDKDKLKTDLILFILGQKGSAEDRANRGLELLIEVFDDIRDLVVDKLNTAAFFQFAITKLKELKF